VPEGADRLLVSFVLVRGLLLAAKHLVLAAMHAVVRARACLGVACHGVAISCGGSCGAAAGASRPMAASNLNARKIWVPVFANLDATNISENIGGDVVRHLVG
jgi:hypothetical protein